MDMSGHVEFHVMGVNTASVKRMSEFESLQNKCSKTIVQQTEG